MANENGAAAAIAQCDREIASCEQEIRNGKPDLDGVTLGLADWAAEKRLLLIELARERGGV